MPKQFLEERNPLQELPTGKSSDGSLSPRGESQLSSPPKSTFSSSDDEDVELTSLVEPTAELHVVSREEATEIELSREDIEKVFSVFGAVKSVTMTGINKAIVKMGSYKELLKAIKFLNFRQLKTNALLTVKWVFRNQRAVQRAVQSDSDYVRSKQQSKINAQCTSMSKYTCKYEIQIPTSNSF